MFIHCFRQLLCAIGESMEVQLPRKGLKLDPRANDPDHVRFSIRYHEEDDDDGITATATATLTRPLHSNNGNISPGPDVGCSFTMRIFDPQTETVPDFTSTVYVYYGLDGERAPSDTTEVIIHPSVKIIKNGAFMYLRSLRRVIIHKNVEVIENSAFSACSSLYAVFLPSSIKEIHGLAFNGCTNLRIISIPQNITVDQIGICAIVGCDTLFRITRLPSYKFDDRLHHQCSVINNDEVHQAIIDFYQNLPPLHKVCLDTDVTAQSIRQCILHHGPQVAYITHFGRGVDQITATCMHIPINSHHWYRSLFFSCIPCLKRTSVQVVEQQRLLPHSEDNESSNNHDDDSCRNIMTPMHILALNPHADTGAILTVFRANMAAMIEPYLYTNSRTPLQCLGEYNLDAYLSVIVALCMHREQQASKIESSIGGVIDGLV